MPWTNASIVLNSRDRTGGTYNASKYNAINQNVIQGQVHSIAVSEINFPYDIPNMQDGYNFFEAEASAIPPADRLLITIPSGFYSGGELADAINTAFLDAAQAYDSGLVAGDIPQFTYDDTNGLFTIEAPASPTTGYADWALYSSYTYYSATNPNRTYLGKDIFSIMGFLQSQGSIGTGGAGNNPLLISPAGAGSLGYVSSAQAAPLAFTQYIDICSPLLCQYQYFRDGSTTNLARRADVICRLYISNNVSIQESEATRPFIINRQFYNARVMRWSAESSVGQIDINLFDDCGTPLVTTWQPRPYQITFNCYEQDKDSTTY